MATTKLTKADLNLIEAQFKRERARLDEDRERKQERLLTGADTWQRRALDAITGAGRILTLFTAETLQAFAVIIIGVLFGILEYERLRHGAMALNQSPEASALIAIAFVTANVIHPIYSLRAVRASGARHRVKHTLRGALSSIWKRIVGKPEDVPLDVYHNPTLHLGAVIITWATIFLALQDVLQPIIQEYSANGASWYASIGALFNADLNQFMQFVSGFLLSVGGVYFLQSASHEIGVRTLTDAPADLSQVKQTIDDEHGRALADLYERIKAEVIAGKVADLERAEHAIGADDANARQVQGAPIESQADFLAISQPVHSQNGNGNRHTT